MKIVIIEDERAAVRNLIALLADVKPEAEVIATLDGIAASIEWFGSHPMPELLFMDIHLADGSAFDIFEEVKITSPIIFTTAYDEYALQAFKVNSIDYLLKPIAEEDISKAFDKLNQLHTDSSRQSYEQAFQNLLHAVKKEESYKTHFLIPVKGDKLLPISIEMISLFYIKDGLVKALLKDKKEYTIPQTLDELAEALNPNLFYRINRQFLISRESVKDMDLWFNNRLSVNLYGITSNEKILVSKAKVLEFKEWFTKRL